MFCFAAANPAAAATGPDKPIRFILPLAEGKSIVGGEFTTWDGLERAGLAQLNSDDSLDIDFVPELEPATVVQCGAVDSNGRIYVGGAIREMKGLALQGIARLTPTGALDRSFQVHLGLNAIVSSILPQSNDSVLIAGIVDGFGPGGYRQSGGAVINSPRSFFVPPDIFNSFRGSARRALLQYDGCWLLAGATGTNTSDRVARFFPDDSLDANFLSSAVGSKSIADMALQDNGKTLIAGSFTSIHTENRRYVARLNPDGTLDHGFDPGTGPDGPVSAVASCLDGKVLIGGRFIEVTGVPRPRIARLKMNGALDEDFNPGAGFDGEVLTIAIAPNGDALIGGAFRTYNGVAAPYFHRLPRLAASDRSTLAFTTGLIFTDEAATNLTVSIFRSGSLAVSAFLQAVIEAGTARPGVDFETTRLAIQFDPGDRSRKFNIGLTAENSIPRDDRTIVIRMTNVIGADLALDRDKTTVTIQDNDGGLIGTYFMGQAFKPQFFSTPVFSRVDNTFAVQWGDGAPGENAPRDFAVIWRGFILPDFSEEYTFYTLSDDQDRLSVAGKWIIDDWKQSFTPGEQKGSIFLEAGKWYPIDIHFDDWGGGPAAILVSWSSGRQPKQIIPRSRLIPRSPLPQPASLLIRPWDRLSGIQVKLFGEAGLLYRIDSSTNLLDWFPWRLVAATSIQTILEDPRITNQGVRFYRATLP
jgi:uncharacterized delta-60 repeat protein